MLNTPENFLLIAVCVSLACAFLIFLNRVWPPGNRRAHNDVIGWQIAIIGTLYAVMVGFMLYAVWGNFQTADTNADNEANSLVNLNRTAEGLPDPQKNVIQNLTQDYATDMITEEWPAMNEGRLGNASRNLIEQLWSAVITTQVNSRAQQAYLDHAMFELTDLTQHRRVRELESQSSLPGILWAVLIAGGIITVISCCLIGSENNVLHFVLILALSLLISLVLAAIADIDGPFRGSVHVSPNAFIRAQSAMSGPK